MTAILAFAVPGLLGWAALPRGLTTSLLGRVLYAYLFGLGLQSFLMFYATLIGIPLSVNRVSGLAALLIGALVLVRRRFEVPEAAASSSRPDADIPGVLPFPRMGRALAMILGLCLAGSVLLVVMESALTFPNNTDAQAFYERKARTIAMRQHARVLEDPVRYARAYPLHFPLQKAWLMMCGFRDHSNLINGLVWSGFILLYYLLARECVGGVLAGLLAFVLVNTPVLRALAIQGFSEGFYAAYLGLGFMHLLRARREAPGKHLSVAGLALAIAANTRPDGLGVALMVAGVWGGAMAVGGRWRLALRLLAPFALCLPWFSYIRAEVPPLGPVVGALVGDPMLFVEEFFKACAFFPREMWALLGALLAHQWLTGARSTAAAFGILMPLVAAWFASAGLAYHLSGYLSEPARLSMAFQESYRFMVGLLVGVFALAGSGSWLAAGPAALAAARGEEETTWPRRPGCPDRCGPPPAGPSPAGR